MSHGRPDDVGAVDAILMAKLLGLVEPFSGHVPQPVPVTDRPLEVPEVRDIRWDMYEHLLTAVHVGDKLVLVTLTGSAALRPFSAERLLSARTGWSPAPPLTGNSDRSWRLSSAFHCSLTHALF